MRILHLTPAYWPVRGGGELYVQELSERLAAGSGQVTVLTSDAITVEDFWRYRREAAAGPRSESIGGVNVVRCPVRPLPLGPGSLFLLRRLAIGLSDLPAGAALSRRLAACFPRLPDLDRELERLEGPFDLVHGFNLSWEYPLVVAADYSRRHGLPFVATPFLHTGEAGRKRVLRNYTMGHQVAALRVADAVVVQTDLEGGALAALGVAPERIVTVGVGVDPEGVRGGDGAGFRRRYGIDGPLVAFVGSIRHDKGADHLVQAVRRLSEEGMRVHLALAGLPSASFRRTYGALPDPVRRHVLLLGPVSEEEKCDLLAAAQLLALPSRVESFGIVLLEAWACGLPVIGARAGALVEVIDEGQDGLLVPYGDAEALGAAVRYLLENPSQAERMGERGRRKVHERYTWDAITGRVKDVYQRVGAARG